MQHMCSSWTAPRGHVSGHRLTEERLTARPTSAEVRGHPEPAAEPRLIGPRLSCSSGDASGRICMSFSVSPARPSHLLAALLKV